MAAADGRSATFRDAILKVLKHEGITIHLLAQALDGKVPRRTLYQYLGDRKPRRRTPTTSTAVLEKIILALLGDIGVYAHYRPRDLKHQLQIRALAANPKARTHKSRTKASAEADDSE